MDELKLVHNSQICVIIEGAEFAKEFSYFITVQLDGQGDKRRTDISARVKNPIFNANTIYLPLPNNKIELSMKLLFACFVVADREQDGAVGKAQARLLGECVVELGPIASGLTDSRTGVRQHLRFTRQADGKSVTVGRFLVTLKLENEATMPVQPTGDNEMYHPIPTNNSFEPFTWRSRLILRYGADIPHNSVSTTGLPSPFVEFGWSQYFKQKPLDRELLRSIVIQNNRNPIWNQQILYNNPRSITNLEGFLWCILRDKLAFEVLDLFPFPISSMRPFHPVHLELKSSRATSNPRAKLVFSLDIEESESLNFQEPLVNIAILGISWDPIPTSTSSVMIALTTSGYPLRE